MGCIGSFTASLSWSMAGSPMFKTFINHAAAHVKLLAGGQPLALLAP